MSCCQIAGTLDFAELEKDPDINKMQFTVNTIVNYLDTKLNGAAA